MTTKKKSRKGTREKIAKTPAASEKKPLISGIGLSEAEHGQAWERGESIPLAKDESE